MAQVSGGHNHNIQRNNKLCMLSLITTIFIMSLHQTASLPSNAPLSSCRTTTFNCGAAITNLSYPFTGGGRPSFCGPPEFHLTCNDGVPELNISSVSYRVLQIDSATLTLARLDLWNETCTHYYVNSTFDGKVFSDGSGNKNLTLFYGCKPFTGFVKPLENLFIECDHYVGVPILEREVDRLVKTRFLLREVLMMGFHVNYSNPYEKECSLCLRSGGNQCGFDSDRNEPICICGDRLCASPGMNPSFCFLLNYGAWWKFLMVIFVSTKVI